MFSATTPVQAFVPGSATSSAALLHFDASEQKRRGKTSVSANVSDAMTYRE